MLIKLCVLSKIVVNKEIYSKFYIIIMININSNLKVNYQENINFKNSNL